MVVVAVVVVVEVDSVVELDVTKGLGVEDADEGEELSDMIVVLD